MTPKQITLRTQTLQATLETTLTERVKGIREKCGQQEKTFAEETAEERQVEGERLAETLVELANWLKE